MKHMISAIVVAAVLVAGSALPGEAGGMRGGGFHGRGSRWHTARPRANSGWHMGRPRGGRGFHRGGGGWHGGTPFFTESGLGWWDVPSPSYAAPPVVVLQASPGHSTQAPTDNIKPAPAPPQHADWHFCQQAGVYYPNGTECPGGWLQVGPGPAPPNQ